MAPNPSLERLRQEVFDLRAALRSRPLVGRALGLLQGRYDLDGDTAFALLRDSAQRHNLKLSTLASTLLAANRRPVRTGSLAGSVAPYPR